MSTDRFKTGFLSRFVLFLACIRHGVKKLFNTDKHRGKPFIILHMKSGNCKKYYNQSSTNNLE